MTEVTNRTVAALLFVAMAVTVFSTAITLNKLNNVQGGSITGFITNPNATAKLNISSTTSIKFTNAVVDWSNGTVNTLGGNLQCNLTTNGWGTGYSGCTGFANPAPGDLTLENDGNQNVQVQVELTKGAAGWIGGTSPNMYFKSFSSATRAGCQSGAQATSTTITNTSQKIACGNLTYPDTQDHLNISLMVTVPSDANVGQKTVDLIATATAV